MSSPRQIPRPKVVRERCDVCKKRIGPHEGSLCSCSKVLCMRHRYKSDHDCKAADTPVHTMEKVEAEKVKKI